MASVYRKIMVADRLPKESGEYDTNLKRLQYFEDLKAWTFCFKPIWWLEEIELPTEEEIKEAAEEYWGSSHFKAGVKHILDYIEKGGKG